MYNCTSVPEVCLVVCTGPVPTLPSLPPYVGLSDGSHSALRPRSLYPIPYFHYSRVSSHTCVMLWAEKTREQNKCKSDLNRIMTERPNMCYWKAECSRMSNMTFPCVNAIQLGPSPFNSSPQCKKKLFTLSFQPKFLKIRFTKVAASRSFLMRQQIFFFLLAKWSQGHVWAK